MAQYTYHIQYNDTIAYEYSSLFDCLFEIYFPACDYYYPTNDGDFLVYTIRGTETECTSLSNEDGLGLFEIELNAARLNAAHAYNEFTDTFYCDESRLPF